MPPLPSAVNTAEGTDAMWLPPRKARLRKCFGDKIYEYSLNVFPGKNFLVDWAYVDIFAKFKRKNIETFHFFPEYTTFVLGEQRKVAVIRYRYSILYSFF